MKIKCANCKMVYLDTKFPSCPYCKMLKLKGMKADGIKITKIENVD